MKYEKKWKITYYIFIIAFFSLMNRTLAINTCKKNISSNFTFLSPEEIILFFIIFNFYYKILYNPVDLLEN